MTEHNGFDGYWEVDGHHNAKGYAALAERLTRHLFQSDFLPTDPPSPDLLPAAP